MYCSNITFAVPNFDGCMIFVVFCHMSFLFSFHISTREKISRKMFIIYSHKTEHRNQQDGAIVLIISI